MHGGKNQAAEPGDPIRGGRPPFTFEYSEVLDEEAARIYHAAASKLGKLDGEIALARTNLYRFQRAHGEQFKGGIPTSVGGNGGSVTVLPYATMVGQYLDRIGKLEEQRARILAANAGGGNPLSPLVQGDALQRMAALVLSPGATVVVSTPTPGKESQ